MKIQELKVVDIPWENKEANQQTVEFETSTKQRFSAFSDGYNFTINEIAHISNFYCIDLGFSSIGFEDYFKGNINNEKKLLKLGQWKYIAFGQIVDIENHDAIIDCGGVYLPIEGLTSDIRCIGEYVSFNIDRLDVEKLSH